MISLFEENLKDLNITFDLLSLKDKVSKFFATNDPMSLQHYLVSALLDKMSAKKGIKNIATKQRK